jgi:small subunit ribosomal protein S2
MSKQKMPKIEDLFDSGVHFGHQVKRWHPNMEPYIFSVRKNIHIINLEDTLVSLEAACNFLYERARNGEQVVFVGTKRQSKEIIEVEAKRCGAKYVTERWLGGTITNFSVIKKNIDKLVDKMKKRDEGEFQKYTKKERLMIDREIDKLQLSVGGIVGLKSKPGAVFVVDSKREKTAVKEAKIANIPVVALIDTNSDPTTIDYPIPGNDDAIKSIAIIVKTIADAVELGYKDFDVKKVKKDDEVKKDKKDVKKEKVKDKKNEKVEETETPEEPTERKVIKVTSDADDLMIIEDLSDKEGLEDISKVLKDEDSETEEGEKAGDGKEGKEDKEEKESKDAGAKESGAEKAKETKKKTNIKKKKPEKKADKKAKDSKKSEKKSKTTEKKEKTSGKDVKKKE